MNMRRFGSGSKAFINKIMRLVVAPILVCGITACKTVTPEFKAAYEKAPAVQVTDLGGRSRVDLKTRPFVTQSFDLTVSSNAKAIVLFFSGRDGRGSNSAGLETALPDKEIGFANIFPPSDFLSGFASGGLRSGSDHVTDVEAVINYVRKSFGLPIWLAGMSMGTVSVANVATSVSEQPDGIIFLSPVTFLSSPYARTRLRDETLVTEFPLSKFKGALLALGHAMDTCSATPPNGTKQIVNAASNANPREARILQGGFDSAGGCSFGAHTFAGVGPELTSIVAKFVLVNSAASKRQ
jgi:hypothetical protein